MTRYLLLFKVQNKNTAVNDVYRTLELRNEIEYDSDILILEDWFLKENTSAETVMLIDWKKLKGITRPE